MSAPISPKTIAIAFLAIAIFISLSAERRACAIVGRLEAHKVTALKPVRLRLLSWILSLATVSLALVIWLFLEV